MSLRGAAFIAGAYEHPRRNIPDRTVAQIHAEVAVGALADAGLSLSDVDAYFCAGDAPGFGADLDGGVPRAAMPHVRLHRDRRLVVPRARGSRRGGDRRRVSARRAHHARRHTAQRRQAARRRRGVLQRARGRLREPVGLLGGRQLRAGRAAAHVRVRHHQRAARRDQGGRVAARAAQSQCSCLRDVVTVEEVVASPLVADPLHRLDCCVITDGGGALVVVSPEVARVAHRARASRCSARAKPAKDTMGGRVDLTYTGAVWSGPRAFDEAGVTPATSTTRRSTTASPSPC